MLVLLGSLFESGASVLEIIVMLLAYFIVILLALSLHEFAHAFAAYKSGDQTPKMQGRITLNPLKHIDPIGVMFCLFFGFGWAKPVQINPNNFRNIKRGIGWTSVAGVLMNFILAFFSCGLYLLMLYIGAVNILAVFFETLFYYMFLINISLAVFNFLPIYPLDGYKFLENITKYNNSFIQFMRKYGTLILILLLLVFSNFLVTLINYVAYPILWFWNLIF